MKVGLIDVDGHNFPNLPLMKLSAWHKQQGDDVEWYFPFGGGYDLVYMSKVFTFTPDYPHPVYANAIKRGVLDTIIQTVANRCRMKWSISIQTTICIQN